MQRPGELAADHEFIHPHDLRLLGLQLRQPYPAGVPDTERLDRGNTHAMRGNVEDLDIGADVPLAELHSRIQRPSRPAAGALAGLSRAP